MRLPSTARSRMSLLATMVMSTLMLSACATDATAPTPGVASTSQEAASPFVPTDAQKALVGITDGTYTFTIDPTRDQQIDLGANRLSLPASSVCKLDGSSGYGAEFWNRSCVPESAPVTITVTVTNAATDNPRLDFYPAMRFSPNKHVTLYIYVPFQTRKFAKQWVIKYCGESRSCINESLTDRDLNTHVDHRNNMVFRRIKHFSGYIVLAFASDAVESMF